MWYSHHDRDAPSPKCQCALSEGAFIESGVESEDVDLLPAATVALHNSKLEG